MHGGRGVRGSDRGCRVTGLLKFWGEVWPNLAANILWVPLVGVHHLLIKRHITRLDQRNRRTEEQQ